MIEEQEAENGTGGNRQSPERSPQPGMEDHRCTTFRSGSSFPGRGWPGESERRKSSKRRAGYKRQTDFFLKVEISVPSAIQAVQMPERRKKPRFLSDSFLSDPMTRSSSRRRRSTSSRL